MARLKQNFREIAKRATQYPAIVVDTHGVRASARLSNNGAVVHNLQVIGGNVSVGESVMVDYTTPNPTIVAMSKSWATMDDLNRLLAKYQIPIPDIKETEYDKVMLFSMDDAEHYQTFPPTRGGILTAQNYAYNIDEEILGDYQGFRHWAIRLPPFEVWPELWGNDISFFRPIHVFSEGTTGARLHGYMSGMGGSTFENIHFYWNAEQEKGQYPTYNFFLDVTGNDDAWYTMNDGDPSPPDEVYHTRFTGCKFTCFGYDFIPSEQEQPTREHLEYNTYENCWLYPPDGSNDVDIIFDNCDFYAQTSENVDWASGVALSETWPPGDGVGRMNVYFINCRIGPGMNKPFNVNADYDTIGDLNVKSITTYNTRWEDVPDIENPDWLWGATLYLDYEGDLSPIDHVHTSGSSGGYDEHAIHLDEAGEF